MQRVFLLLILFTARSAGAQELFVFTEPASNMPVKSIGIRMNNYLADEVNSPRVKYMLAPEIMWGVSKKLLIHVEGFLSDQNKKFNFNGVAVYTKYRLYTTDNVHSHFRMGAFGRYSFNNSYITQNAIDLNGRNSGYEGGIVATKLVQKVAISASGSFLHALNNGTQKFLYNNKSRNAVNYTLSVGTLMLPKEYTSYKQTNVNLMLEMLGQTNVYSGYSYLDLAPSVQFIFLSKMRVDAGYRIPLVKDLSRSSNGIFLLRLEYNIFNAY